MASSRAVLVAVVVAAWAGGARAQPLPPVEDEARARFEQAVQLYNQGDKEGALAGFLRVYELRPRPSVLFNIGLLYAAVNDPAKAVETLERVLAEPGNLSEARRRKARAVHDEQQQRLGLLVIDVPVNGALVEVDNKVVGQSPFSAPVRVPSGRVLVQAVAPRHMPTRVEVDVPAGGTAEVKVPLQPLDRALAQLRVRSATPGADVLLNGQRVGTTPLAATIPVVPGPVTVALVREGYAPRQQQLSLGEGAQGEVVLDLEEDRVATARSGARLTVQASETQVVTSVNGRPRGVYDGPLLLPPGPHQLLFERGGFQPVLREVELSPGAQETLVVTFEPTPELLASLEAEAGVKRTFGVTALVGGGALAVGGGVALGVMLQDAAAAQQDVRYWNEQLTATTSDSICVSQGAAANCQGRYDAAVARRDQAQGLAWLSGGVAVAGVLLAAAGATSLALVPDLSRYGRKPDASELVPEFSLDLQLSPSGVAVAGRF